MIRPITVGVDESPRSDAALDWAIDEARRMSLPLRLVHAWTWYPPVSLATGMGWASSGESMEAEAKAVLDRAAAKVAAASLDGPGVKAEMILDQAGPALVQASKESAMLVVGSRGAGGLTGQLLGSVSLHTAGHARCPVVVVPDTAAARGPRTAGLPAAATSPPARPMILLGLDVLHPVEPAIEFACEQAAAWNGRLAALHAWTSPVVEQPRFANPLAYSDEVADMDVRRALEGQLAPWLEKYPSVPIEIESVHGRPARALVSAAAQADLVVVGARHRLASFPGFVLGTVNHAVLHHAPCPVAVVPDR